MVQPVKVYTPYVPDTAQLCRNGTTEYYSKRVSLCCSRCKPGTRMTVECSANSDTVCQPCPKSQYINTFHFTSKCFRCSRCSEDKGLRYVHYCTSSTNALCACKPGMYCRLGRNPECMECASYKSCEPGSGVSEHETDDSDVTCTPCPFGTFSNKHSYNQTCQQHTDCKSQGRHPLTDGNATSDVTCGPELNESQTTTTPSQLTTPPSGTGHTTANLPGLHTSTLRSLHRSTLRSLHTPTLRSLHTTTLPTNLVLNDTSTDRLITPTEGIPPGFDPRIVAGVITSLLLLVIGGMFLCKKVFCQPRRASSTEEDSQKAVLKLDSDGPLTIRYSSIKAFCQEKMYLLEDGTKPSLPETQQGTTMFNSPEGLSIGPQSTLQQPSTLQATLQQPSTLQATLQQPSTLRATLQQPSTLQATLQQPSTPVNTLQSPLQQPSTLQSSLQQPSTLVNTPQPSILQPNSSLPSSPLVNVNITVNCPVNMGNGICATPFSSTTTDSSQEHFETPLSREEEYVNLPLQEGGKETLIATQESGHYI